MRIVAFLFVFVVTCASLRAGDQARMDRYAALQAGASGTDRGDEALFSSLVEWAAALTESVRPMCASETFLVQKRVQIDKTARPPRASVALEYYLGSGAVLPFVENKVEFVLGEGFAPAKLVWFGSKACDVTLTREHATRLAPVQRARILEVAQGLIEHDRPVVRGLFARIGCALDVINGQPRRAKCELLYFRSRRAILEDVKCEMEFQLDESGSPVKLVKANGKAVDVAIHHGPMYRLADSVEKEITAMIRARVEKNDSSLARLVCIGGSGLVHDGSSPPKARCQLEYWVRPHGDRASNQGGSSGEQLGSALADLMIATSPWTRFEAVVQLDATGRPKEILSLR